MTLTRNRRVWAQFAPQFDRLMAGMGQFRHIRLALRKFSFRQSGAALAAPTAAFAVSLATSLSVFGDSKPATLSYADTFGPPIEIAALPAPDSFQHRDTLR